MTEPLAYLNGQLLPASGASLSINDAGFVLGATVTEQLRTFHGEIFRLPEHLERLKQSLQVAGIQTQESLTDLADIAARLVASNWPLIHPDDDLGLSIFITPGSYAALAEGERTPPTVCLHTYRLQFQFWAKAYTSGASLATTEIQQVPAACWSPALKCRSRMHYFLADQQATAKHPGARALLLNEQGFVSETSTANVVLWRANEGLISPPRTQALPGISLQVLKELAGRLELSFVERQIRPEELGTAEEALLTSTPNCLLPVTYFNGRPIGSGKPGEIYRQLLAAWNEMVELDIAAQAQRFASR